VESIRVFDIETQLSKEQRAEVEIIPDLLRDTESTHVSFLEFIPAYSWLTFSNAAFVRERINLLYDEALVKANEGEHKAPHLHKSRITGDEFIGQVQPFRKMEWSEKTYFQAKQESALIPPSTDFHKNFDLVADNLKKGYPKVTNFMS